MGEIAARLGDRPWVHPMLKSASRFGVDEEYLALEIPLADRSGDLPPRPAGSGSTTKAKEDSSARVRRIATRPAIRSFICRTRWPPSRGTPSASTDSPSSRGAATPAAGSVAGPTSAPTAMCCRSTAGANSLRRGRTVVAFGRIYGGTPVGSRICRPGAGPRGRSRSGRNCGWRESDFRRPDRRGARPGRPPRHAAEGVLRPAGCRRAALRKGGRDPGAPLRR